MNHIAGAVDFKSAFGVSRETIARLETYAGLLVQWQKTTNLVAASTLPGLWQRHFADSAQLLVLAPRGPVTWVDLGSGGGFPGLVIGCMLAEDAGSRLILIESDGRKCAFLREVVRQTSLGTLVTVDILTSRIEMAANTASVGSVDVISARALAPMGRLLGWCQPFFGSETVALLPKGRDAETELAAARRIWRFEAELVPSQTQRDGRIVELRGLKRA